MPCADTSQYTPNVVCDAASRWRWGRLLDLPNASHEPYEPRLELCPGFQHAGCRFTQHRGFSTFVCDACSGGGAAALRRHNVTTLTGIPVFFPNDLRLLQVTCHQLLMVADTDLQSVLYLTALNLSHNAITKAEFFAFRMPFDLQELDLSHNTLTHLDWRGLPLEGHLLQLSLANNQIQTMERLALRSTFPRACDAARPLRLDMNHNPCQCQLAPTSRDCGLLACDPQCYRNGGGSPSSPTLGPAADLSCAGFQDPRLNTEKKALHMDQICDGVQDCRNGWDELLCGMVVRETKRFPQTKIFRDCFGASLRIHFLRAVGTMGPNTTEDLSASACIYEPHAQRRSVPFRLDAAGIAVETIQIPADFGSTVTDMSMTMQAANHSFLWVNFSTLLEGRTAQFAGGYDILVHGSGHLAPATPEGSSSDGSPPVVLVMVGTGAVLVVAVVAALCLLRTRTVRQRRQLTRQSSHLEALLESTFLQGAGAAEHNAARRIRVCYRHVVAPRARGGGGMRASCGALTAVCVAAIGITCARAGCWGKATLALLWRYNKPGVGTRRAL